MFTYRDVRHAFLREFSLECRHPHCCYGRWFSKLLVLESPEELVARDELCVHRCDSESATTMFASKDADKGNSKDDDTQSSRYAMFMSQSPTHPRMGRWHAHLTIALGRRIATAKQGPTRMHVQMGFDVLWAACICKLARRFMHGLQGYDRTLSSTSQFLLSTCICKECTVDVHQHMPGM
jgi:hypothetical protein